MKKYNFKELIEIALDDGKAEDEQMYDIREIMYCVDIDDILIHEEDWVGPKPGKDIELFGEHWYKDHWDENDRDTMEGFHTLLD